MVGVAFEERRGHLKAPTEDTRVIQLRCLPSATADNKAWPCSVFGDIRKRMQPMRKTIFKYTQIYMQDAR